MEFNKGISLASLSKQNTSFINTLHFDNVWDAQTYQSFINIKISQFAKYPCLNQILIFRPIKARALFIKNYFVRCCTSCDMTLNWLGDSIDKNFFCWFDTTLYFKCYFFQRCKHINKCKNYEPSLESILNELLHHLHSLRQIKKLILCYVFLLKNMNYSKRL